MNHTEKKLNYILATLSKIKSTNVDDDLITWLRENRSTLTSLTHVYDALEEEGLTINDFKNQIQFGKEYMAILNFQNEYSESRKNGVHTLLPGTLTYELAMMKQHGEKLDQLRSTTNTIDVMTPTTGVLLIPLQTAKINTTNTNEYFSSGNGQNALVVTQFNEYQVVRIVTQSGVHLISVSNVVIVGLEQINNIVNKRFIVLPYLLSPDKTYYSITATTAQISIDNNTIILVQSDETRIDVTEFKAYISNLPRGVYSVNNLTSTYFDENYEPIKNAYIDSLLQELIPQASNTYQQLYGKDLTYGLYGQGAAVSISQLYNLAASTLRKVSVNYDLETAQGTQASKWLESVVDFQESRMKLPTTTNVVYGRADIRNYNFNTVYPKYQIGNLSGGKITYTDPLAQVRLNTSKVKIMRYDGTKATPQDSWFETRMSNITNIAKGTEVVRLVGTTTSTVYDRYQLSYISTPIQNGAKIYGLLLNVYQGGNDDEYELQIDTTYSCTALTELYYIIKPDNLSSESTTPMTINISYTINGTEKSQTLAMTPQRIEYGDGTANAYVGLAEINQGETAYVVRSIVPFKRSSYPGTYYSGLDLTQRLTSVNRNTFDIPSNTTTTIDFTAGSTVSVSSWESKVPGYTYHDLAHTYRSRLLVTPPFAWPYWGDDIMNFDDFTSCYHSLSTELPGNVNSTLTLTNNTAQWTVTVNKYESNNIQTYEQMADGTINPYTKDFTTDFVENIISNFGTITGGKISLLNSVSQVTLTAMTGQVDELELPEGIYNQFSLSESIINLQYNVAFLTQYADYLKYLIDNTNDRVTNVENTMQQVIETMNSIIDALTPKERSVGGQILSFLGNSIGMFFPLTGLAVSIVSQLYEGIVEIKDGNVLVGAMDIASGALMSALGIRKYKQRMDRKYGTNTDIIRPENSGLPTYESLYGPPGYNAVGTNLPPSYEEATRMSGGLLKNATIDTSGAKTTIQTYMYQDAIYNSFQLSRSNDQSIPLVMFKVEEIWNDGDTTPTINYYAVMQTRNANFDIEEQVLSDQQFKSALATTLTINQFVSCLYAYSNMARQISDGLGFDPEVFSTILLSMNQGSRDNTASESTRATRHPTLVPRFNRVERTNRLKSLRKLTKVTNPEISVLDLSNAFNPFINDTRVQMQVFDNIVSKCEEV